MWEKSKKKNNKKTSPGWLEDQRNEALIPEATFRRVTLANEQRRCVRLFDIKYLRTN